MIETTLKAGATRPPEIRAAIPPATGQGVLDESTFDAIEVGRLFDVINSARTRIGQASLFRALARPPFTFAEIRHRQEALLEIDTDPELKSGIEALVNDAQKREQGFYDLLYNNFLGLFGDPKHDLESSGFGYQSYQTGTFFCRKLVDGAASIKKTRIDIPQTTLRGTERLRTVSGICSNAGAGLLLRGQCYYP